MLALSMPKTIKLIGGDSHGESVEVSEGADSIPSPEVTEDRPTFTTAGSQTYIRRHFEGEEFGDGSDFFGVATDDDTETKELARMTIKSDTANDPDKHTRSASR
jgi:hypothetical protein